MTHILLPSDMQVVDPDRPVKFWLVRYHPNDVGPRMVQFGEPPCMMWAIIPAYDAETAIFAASTGPLQTSHNRGFYSATPARRGGVPRARVGRGGGGGRMSFGDDDRLVTEFHRYGKIRRIYVAAEEARRD